MSDAKTMSPAGRAARYRVPLIEPLVVMGLIALPFVFPQPFLLTVLTQAAIFAIAAMSLDLLLGVTGLASFGQAAFFGIGAYAAALVGIHVTNALPVTLAAALLASGVMALLGGLLVVRTSGIYFIFLTLALSQLVFVVAFKWRTVTGGDDGLSGLTRPSLGALERLVDLTNDRVFYILAILVAAGVYMLLRRIVNSCFGSVLTGIRDNPGRMRAIGYDIRAYKIAAFVIAGVLTGLAGALFTYQYGLVTPEQAHWQTSALMMVMVILGGSGSLVGAVLGALIVIVLQNVVSTYTDRWASIMALLFMGIVLFARGGVWGLLTRSGDGSRA